MMNGAQPFDEHFFFFFTPPLVEFVTRTLPVQHNIAVRTFVKVGDKVPVNFVKGMSGKTDSTVKNVQLIAV